MNGAGSAVVEGNDTICLIIFLNWVSNVLSSTDVGKSISRPYKSTGKTYVRRRWIEVSGSRQKGGDLTQSYDKSPYTNRNVKGAK